MFMETGYGKRSARGQSDLENLHVSALARLFINTIDWATRIAYSLSFLRAKSSLFAKPEIFRYHTRLKRHG